MQCVMTKEEIRYLLDMPFEQKVSRTNSVLDRYFHENPEVSGMAYSGGKDSTLVLAMCHRYIRTQEYRGTFYAFCSMCEGNQQKQKVELAKNRFSDGVVIHQDWPKTYAGVDKPLLNKQFDYYIHEQQIHRLKGINFLSEYRDAPIHKVINSRCCDIIKKYPSDIFFKSKGVRTILTGMRATESLHRYVSYMQHGCYMTGHRTAMPIGFWKSDDVIRGLDLYKCSDIYVANEGNRSGCPWCPYGKPRIQESTIATIQKRLKQYLELRDRINKYRQQNWRFDEYAKS